mmetsp:Transcript_16828/g.53830  ORF Transcript_16828/g.53830 Transcript_16828/m.53830 type:complete len:241 (+) Transcript_16828:1435-2157(+)
MLVNIFVHSTASRCTRRTRRRRSSRATTAHQRSEVSAQPRDRLDLSQGGGQRMHGGAMTCLVAMPRREGQVRRPRLVGPAAAPGGAPPAARARASVIRRGAARRTVESGRRWRRGWLRSSCRLSFIVRRVEALRSPPTGARHPARAAGADRPRAAPFAASLFDGRLGRIAHSGSLGIVLHIGHIRLRVMVRAVALLQCLQLLQAAGNGGSPGPGAGSSARRPGAPRGRLDSATTRTATDR